VGRERKEGRKEGREEGREEGRKEGRWERREGGIRVVRVVRIGSDLV
jgi:flagellar biosynthesis/type III secretory pathway protein FliH